MTNYAAWHLNDGTPMWSYLESVGTKVIKQSRKGFMCALGCTIPKGSEYLRVDLMEMTGSCDGGSRFALAICADHMARFRNSGGDFDKFHVPNDLLLLSDPPGQAAPA